MSSINLDEILPIETVEVTEDEFDNTYLDLSSPLDQTIDSPKITNPPKEPSLTVNLWQPQASAELVEAGVFEVKVHKVEVKSKLKRTLNLSKKESDHVGGTVKHKLKTDEEGQAQQWVNHIQDDIKKWAPTSLMKEPPIHEEEKENE